MRYKESSSNLHDLYADMERAGQFVEELERELRAVRDTDFTSPEVRVLEMRIQQANKVYQKAVAAYAAAVPKHLWAR